MRFSAGAYLIMASDVWLAALSVEMGEAAGDDMTIDRSWARIVRAVRFLTPIFCINFVT
jgi:hypothetical protein